MRQSDRFRLTLAGPPGEWETRETIEGLLREAKTLITLNSTDDNYRSLGVGEAVHVLHIIRNKLDRAVKLAEGYAAEHAKFPKI